MSELALDELTEDWAAVKRIPDQTGLSRAVGSRRTRVIRMTAGSRSAACGAGADIGRTLSLSR